MTSSVCIDPPEKALVLCVDEKPQIQALDHFQPVLPMVPGAPERRNHDYVRAGTTTLFTVLIVRHRQGHRLPHRPPPRGGVQEVPHEAGQGIPAGLRVHPILDNYATRKTPDIKRWLLTHPRFRMPITIPVAYN
ncbi:hypothetical protein ACWGIB_08255 [Streptomyces xiamenensis]